MRNPSKHGCTLLIDNYDSFTYNLVQYIGELGSEVKVFRNDAITVAECLALQPDRVVISPGPGYPSGAGISKAIVAAFAGVVPVFGVCLGHQSIVEEFGGKIVNSEQIVHGKTSMVSHDSQGVFLDLPNPLECTRYHSLVAESSSIPDCLQVTSRTSDGLVMGVRHREFIVEGVQFHPESITSAKGMDMIRNFLNFRGGRWSSES